MEPLGLAIAIPPLLSLIFDILDKVTAFQGYGTSSRQLNARFVGAKFRLQDWARNVGFVDGRLADAHHPRLDNPEVIVVVKTVLDCLRNTFDKSENISRGLNTRYDLSRAIPNQIEDVASDHLPLQRTNTGSHRLAKSAHATKEAFSWAAKRKNVFVEEVESFEILVDRLYDIVSPNETSDNANLGPLTLKSLETLQEEIRLIAYTKQQDAKRQAQSHIDEWLDAPMVDQGYEELVETRLEGTCNWIVDNEECKAWVHDDFYDNQAKLFWISGPAGHGKTVSNAHIVRIVKETSMHPSAFFFVTPHIQAQCQPLDIIRSWLSQLCRTDTKIFDFARDTILADQSSRQGTQSQVWNLFTEIITQCERCTLTIDGYDEFPKNDGARSRFLNKLRSAIAGTQTRLMVSSRPEEDIRLELVLCVEGIRGVKLYQCKMTADVVKHDISLYANKIVVDQLPSQSRKWQQELASQMAQKCDGMFLWIKLQKPLLREGKSRKQLYSSIEKMPAGLVGTYDRNWQAVQALPEEDRLRAMNIFRWACFAIRPLTVGEIAEALVHEDEVTGSCEDNLPDQINDAYVNGEIRVLCGSLIEIQAPVNKQELLHHTIRVVHASAREFLVRALTVSMMPSGMPTDAESTSSHHIHLAAICVRYLLCKSTWSTWSHEDSQQDVTRERPFYAYARRIWREHTRASTMHSKDFNRLTLELFDSRNQFFARWIGTDQYYASKNIRRQPGDDLNLRLWFAVWFNLPHVMDHLHDVQQLDLTPTQYSTETALILSTWKDDDIFDRLLRWGADVNFNSKIYGTALVCSVRLRSLYKTRRLLDMGASTKIIPDSGQPVVSLACEKGDIEVLKLLLEHKADPNHFDNPDQSPLFAAIEKCDTRAVELLIQHGADVTITDVDGFTVLHHACCLTNVRVSELLLQAGAEVSTANNDGWTPLHFAADEGLSEQVTLLLRHGADVNAVNILSRAGSSVLHCAVSSTSIKTVQVLVNAGVRLDDTCALGSTPLIIAILTNKLPVVDLLIENGASLSTPVYLGRTPFEHIDFYYREHEKPSGWRRVAKDSVIQSSRSSRLRNEIYDISRKLLELGYIDGGFDQLGRCLALLNLLAEADYAFQQGILSGRTACECMHANVCDICDTGIKGLRHVCIDCYDVDFCTRCYRSLQTDDLYMRCCQHQFMHIHGTRDPSIKDMAERMLVPEVIQWLQQNLTKFKPGAAGISCPEQIVAKDKWETKMTGWLEWIDQVVSKQETIPAPVQFDLEDATDLSL